MPLKDSLVKVLLRLLMKDGLTWQCPCVTVEGVGGDYGRPVTAAAAGDRVVEAGAEAAEGPDSQYGNPAATYREPGGRAHI